MRLGGGAVFRDQGVLLSNPTTKGVFRRGTHLFSMLSVPRKRIVLLVGLAVTLAVLEGIGVGLLNPVLQYVEYGNTDNVSGIFGDAPVGRPRRPGPV